MANARLRSEVADRAERLGMARWRTGQPAFVNGAESDDDLAEVLAEHALEEAISGVHTADMAGSAEVDEDFGGPFVEISASSQFGHEAEGDVEDEVEPSPFPVANGQEAEEDEE